MLAKVKLTQDIGDWRVEGRTVIHRSWAGYTWRKKGSDLAYYEGCTFPSPPELPPPPPATAYKVLVGVRYEGEYRIIFVYAEKFHDEEKVAWGTGTVITLPIDYMIGWWEVKELSYSATRLYKVYRFNYFTPEGEEFWAELVFNDDWNGIVYEWLEELETEILTV